MQDGCRMLAAGFWQLSVCMISCVALIVHMCDIDMHRQIYNMSCGSSALNCCMHRMDQILKSRSAGNMLLSTQETSCNMAHEFVSEMSSTIV